ncbi:MAG: hypothetical protein ACRD2U_12540 [Terriglobales bacterium]
MKRITVLATLILIAAVPTLLVAQSSFTENHVEVGAFADYLRFAPVNPQINFVGLGGRVAFNVHPNIQLEAEMSYDFYRNYTSTFSNGVSTSFATTRLRPLTGLFGPKFQAGSSGPVRVFVTGKVGFINFTSTTGPASGGSFVNSVNNVPYGDTHVAFYPGGGIEGFAGPIGLRLDVGDEIFLDNGTHNNLRVTFGPHFRF